MPEHTSGGVRFIPADEKAGTGPILLSRSWMKGPAQFKGDDTSFDQDFQIETYYERAPGELWHAYGVWREVHLKTLNLSSDSNERPLAAAWYMNIE